VHEYLHSNFRNYYYSSRWLVPVPIKTEEYNDLILPFSYFSLEIIFSNALVSKIHLLPPSMLYSSPSDLYVHPNVSCPYLATATYSLHYIKIIEMTKDSFDFTHITATADITCFPPYTSRIPLFPRSDTSQSHSYQDPTVMSVPFLS
jgi:hypothetical protein